MTYTIRMWRPWCDWGRETRSGYTRCMSYALYRVWESSAHGYDSWPHHGYYCRAHAEATARRLEREEAARPAGEEARGDG